MEFQDIITKFSQSSSANNGSQSIIAELSKLKETITELQAAVDDYNKKEIDIKINECLILFFNVFDNLNITDLSINISFIDKLYAKNKKIQ